MKIGNFDLDQDVLIVAEIGNNHEGSYARAEEMIGLAAEAGVGAVKFQTFKTEYYISKDETARFGRLKSFELDHSQFERLAQLAHSLGILFISTPFDLPSARFLDAIVDAYKIASGDNNFYPLIACVASTGKPLIISSGASDSEQIARTIAFVREQWREKAITGELAVLHCVSSYPVEPSQANLRAMQVLVQDRDVTAGYSDHTMGNGAAVLAVALGARIIEKHFTVDKHLSDFRDHQLSADPAEMRELVQRIREAVVMLGDAEKRIQPCERPLLDAIRRSIVAGRDLPRGHRIQLSDLTWIRPAGGLPPGEEHRLIGRVLKRDVCFGKQLSLTDLD